MKAEEAPEKEKICSNCNHSLSKKAKFCSRCGQKTSSVKISMGQMFKKLWETTFHLEGRLFRSLSDLMVPGRMTQQFFQGKQRKYVHPLRIFLVIAFFLLLMLHLYQSKMEQAGGKGVVNFTATNSDSSNIRRDSLIGMSLHDELQFKARLFDLHATYDSLPVALRTQESRKAVDSLLSIYARQHGFNTNFLFSKRDSININFWADSIKIDDWDVARYNAEEIIERYKVDGYLQKTAVRQTVKTLRDPSALGHAIIGSLSWTILTLTFMMSGILWLLYLRQKRYYVEHFIFLLHFHSGAMLLPLLLLVLLYLHLISPTWLASAIVLTIPALYLAMWRYYQQGWFKTFVKFGIFAFFYSLIFSIFLIGGMLVVFAVF